MAVSEAGERLNLCVLLPRRPATSAPRASAARAAAPASLCANG